jgi:import receptor subunit TOM70
MEKSTKPLGMNVLPLINKALALFQWKQDFAEAEKLCQKALISEIPIKRGHGIQANLA